MQKIFYSLATVALFFVLGFGLSLIAGEENATVSQAKGAPWKTVSWELLEPSEAKPEVAQPKIVDVKEVEIKSAQSEIVEDKAVIIEGVVLESPAVTLAPAIPIAESPVSPSFSEVNPVFTPATIQQIHQPATWSVPAEPTVSSAPICFSGG